jgi:VanZ family protein
MQHTTLQLGVRICAWASLAAIVLLSLLPSDGVVRTGASGKLEHVVAYLGASFLVAMAHGTRARVIAGLFVCAGVLECLQTFSPGRTPSLFDFAGSSSGIVLGVGLATIIRWRIGPLDHSKGAD